MYIFNSFVLKSFFKQPPPFIIKLPMILVVHKGKRQTIATDHCTLSHISNIRLLQNVLKDLCWQCVFLKCLWLEVGVVVLSAIYLYVSAIYIQWFIVGIFFFKFLLIWSFLQLHRSKDFQNKDSHYHLNVRSMPRLHEIISTKAKLRIKRQQRWDDFLFK